MCVVCVRVCVRACVRVPTHSHLWLHADLRLRHRQVTKGTRETGLQTGWGTGISSSFAVL